MCALPSASAMRELGQDAGRQAEVDADREDVPAAHAAAGADDQLVVGERRADRLDQRVGGLAGRRP